jgi:hypothetical protein
MPATTTATNACGVSIFLDDAGGTLRDISGSSNEVNLKFSNSLGEYKVFGDSSTYRIECAQDASLEMTILYTRTNNEGMDILKNWRETRGARTVQINMPTNTPGADRYTGEFFYEDIDIPLKADEAKPVMCKVTLKPNGYVDLSVVP